MWNFSKIDKIFIEQTVILSGANAVTNCDARLGCIGIFSTRFRTLFCERRPIWPYKSNLGLPRFGLKLENSAFTRFSRENLSHTNRTIYDLNFSLKWRWVLGKSLLPFRRSKLRKITKTFSPSKSNHTRTNLTPVSRFNHTGKSVPLVSPISVIQRKKKKSKFADTPRSGERSSRNFNQLLLFANCCWWCCCCCYFGSFWTVFMRAWQMNNNKRQGGSKYIL